MKIYILRHEDRTQDATMFSPLTKEGLKKSIDLSDILKDLNIDLIYSSPFIRTLQTVQPYAKSRNKKINLEYGLEEIQHPSLIPENSYTVSLPIYICESFNYNPKYKSTLEPENNKYPANRCSAPDLSSYMLLRQTYIKLHQNVKTILLDIRKYLR